VRKLLGALLLVVLALSVVVSVRAGRLQSRQPAPGTPAAVTVDARVAAARLADVIRFRTITSEDVASFAPQPWLELQTYLASSFPRINAGLLKESVAEYSVLYTWKGRRTELAPVILTGHLDVVPADERPEAGWRHPPFGGVIAEDAVWGRGALDDKSGAMGILEAVESLLSTGFTPERTVYLAFGHNEEGGRGESGASAIAALLKSRGVADAVLLDEGGWIYEKIPGVRQHVALIGIAEKGFVSLELVVPSTGGHSSMPPKESAIGVLSKALLALESHPMPARLDGASAQLFDTLAPEMSFGMRALFANLWLIRPIVLWQLGKSPASSATVRTTTAPTMLAASDKENVMPVSARAVVNFRLIPGDTPDTVIAHVKRVVADDRVTVSLYRGSAGVTATTLTRTDTGEFDALGSAIRAVFPEVLVAPYLTVGATDARRYAEIASSIYRFVPIDQPGATELLHATNEHVSIEAYGKAIRAYATIITSLTKR
jgi:carboxypeptidase PM20D1